MEFLSLTTLSPWLSMVFLSLPGDEGSCRPPWKVSLYVLKEKNVLSREMLHSLTVLGVGSYLAFHSCYLRSPC